MRIVLFYHSLISDWNHGNAHFVRGIVSELLERSHDVVVYEPLHGWSRQQLLAEAGPAAVSRFRSLFPRLQSKAVDLDRLDLDEALDNADLVIVHEWNPHSVVSAIGRHRSAGGKYVLLFHDTHHRSVTDVPGMAAYDLDAYDGVLAFGDVIRQRYVSFGWARRAFTWHEAADTRIFRPLEPDGTQDDLVWIGNWGDEERTAELRSYLVGPVRALRLTATVHGVRYPSDALAELIDAGIRYAGWLPNYEAPLAYARHRMTVHIPRRPYVQSLPGIPTIRVFEALACGVPLVSVGWNDVEGLFTPGDDYLVADTPSRMRSHLASLRADETLRKALAAHGLDTIRRRHTCAHRVDELLAIVRQMCGIPQEALSA
ncbi:MAG TPA: glycosyltransferase [Vicinamibacterales bacterium]|nr:glycosyltransferase [Vicinamibacterales bacterium]